mmetsp:Transcript_52920/g.126325  ORF Transcript_52920/g.126325 Transcript_52920/m.126325 type:complete len:540 (+) Transcript_52920:183-1802(+)
MSTVADLRVSLTKASPNEDHSTYKYHIQLKYGETTWEVARRFSEFDNLLQSLAACKYGGLPKLPTKTFLGSPLDAGSIECRKQQLRIIVHDLLFRPDTRSAQQVRQFLALDSHTDIRFRSIQPDALRTFEDPRFGVSGLCVAPEANVLLVSHEDSTHLSRLGRVWSVVEPDELGAVHLWSQAQGGDSGWKRKFSHTYGIKARALCWEENTRQFFVGLEDGRVEVYAVGTDLGHPSLVASMELHHKSPVTHISAADRSVLSLGFDTAMRVLDVRTREVKCGGRLNKRMRTEADYPSAGYLDAVEERAFIGTTAGDVLILDVSKNPPGFLHTIELDAKPVSMMCPMQDKFLIAHGERVTVMSYEGKTLERRMVKLGSHRTKHLPVEEATILSLAISVDRGLVFGGYSDGSVAIWSCRDSEAFIVLKAHSSETTQLAWVEAAPWGPALFTGGGDGKVITWSLSENHEDCAFWQPQSVDMEDMPSINSVPISGTSDMLSSPEPTSLGGGADLFRIDNPRVNPQALRQEGESDSDNEDIVSAFR